MKLSDQTMVILKNFASINESIVIKPGNVLRILSKEPLKAIFAEAVVENQFPKMVGIHDLNKLLAKISMYSDPVLDFKDTRLAIKDSSNKKNDHICYAAPETIISPPDKSINIGTTDCTFTLTKEDLLWMKKSAGISGSPHFVFESDGEKIKFSALDVKDSSSDVSSTEVGESDGQKFKVVMMASYLKLIDGTYEVAVAKKGLARFKHKDIDLSYYIAFEAGLCEFGA